MVRPAGQTGELQEPAPAKAGVGVFAALCHGERHIPIDGRLYLPKEWVEDRKRCRRAGVPEAQIVARSKAQHALAMVQQARTAGLRFAWVGVDGGYGKACPRASPVGTLAAAGIGRRG